MALKVRFVAASVLSFSTGHRLFGLNKILFFFVVVSCPHGNFRKGRVGRHGFTQGIDTARIQRARKGEIAQILCVG